MNKNVNQNELNDILIDFGITSKCDKNCAMCFRNPNINDISLPKIKQAIQKLHSIGFRKIGFTGGEPTFRNDYIQIITHAKQLGFLTYLSTIGENFIQDLKQLENQLDWIGLPIDGITPETNTQSRSNKMAHQHNLIKNIMTHLSNNPTKIKIKLTTVVSNTNKQELNQIITFVKTLPYQYKIWRFYQYCPRGIGKQNKDKLFIPTQEFIQTMQNIKNTYQDNRIGYGTYEEDRNRANIVIEANLDTIIPDRENYKYLFNIAKDSQGQIIKTIFENPEIIIRCKNNRHWINE